MITNEVNADVIFKSANKYDPRLGDLTKFLKAGSSANDFSKDIVKGSTVICGYPDDEGIKNNKGRAGAAAGPDSIRRIFYKMTPQANLPTEIVDAGNLSLDTPLNERHEKARALALSCLSRGHRWVGIGGGHDYGYPDGAAFVEFAQSKKQKPLIINFDAHLDVRSDENGINSGTPFFRILEKYDKIDFAEIGLQHHCNAHAHLEYVVRKKGKCLFNNDIMSSSLLVATKKLLKPWTKKNRLTFISVDIDVFSSSFAMGASQSWPSGITPQVFFPTFKWLLKTFNVAALGIYEVSPPLDFDNLTSKLAAEILHRYIYKGG